MTDTAVNRVRVVLAFSCWTLVGILFLGLVLSAPDIIAALEGRGPEVQILDYGSAVTIVLGLLMSTVWVSAIWHNAIDQRVRNTPKSVTLVLLFAGTFIAGLFYYYVFLVWQSRDVQTVRTRLGERTP